MSNKSGKATFLSAVITVATIAGAFAATQDEERSYLPPGHNSSQPSADAQAPAKAKSTAKSRASAAARTFRTSGRSATLVKSRKQPAKSAKYARTTAAVAARPRKARVRVAQRPYYYQRQRRGWQHYAAPRYRYASPGFFPNIFGF